MFGDLVLLLYMMVVMIGEGEVKFEGVVLYGVEVFMWVGLFLIEFGVKEGFVCINGI